MITPTTADTLTASNAPAHVDPVPPPTGLTAVWKHLKDWATIWFWVPFSLVGIWLFSKLAYGLTGREPQESVDWIVGFSFTLVKCVFLILFVEIVRQQTGNWWKPEDLKENPHLAIIQAVTKCVTLIVFAFVITR